jgi:hypothetical protein
MKSLFAVEPGNVEMGADLRNVRGRADRHRSAIDGPRARGAYVFAMNTSDEVRYLNQLVDALSSGRMRLYEGDRDVTDREIGRLSTEVAAVEAMLAALQSGRSEF